MQFIPREPHPRKLFYFSLLTLKSPSVITRGKRKIITREERKLQFSALMFIINKKDFLKGIGNYKN